MAKIYRFLGKRGNTTIPYPLRLAMGLKRYDLISYELDGDTIILKRERICDNCASDSDQTQIPGFAEPKPQKKQNTKHSGARKTLPLLV